MKFKDDEVRDFWRNQAVAYGEDHRASWADGPAIALEIGEISKYLRDGLKVIDIGCANGFSTLNYAQRYRIDIKGVDYIPEMIAAAKDRLAGIASSLTSSVTFDTGDIAALDEADGAYDAAIVTRVIINLGDRDRQIAAIREAARVVKTGGVLLLSEATQEGLQNLNGFRAEWGLGPIPEPAFNRYIDDSLIEKASKGLLHLEQVCNFASSYFIGTRVLKPLMAQALERNVDLARSDTHWNRFFSMLPAAGDYGTQKLFVFRRK